MSYGHNEFMIQIGPNLRLIIFLSVECVSTFEWMGRLEATCWRLSTAITSCPTSDPLVSLLPSPHPCWSCKSFCGFRHVSWLYCLEVWVVTVLLSAHSCMCCCIAYFGSLHVKYYLARKSDRCRLIPLIVSVNALNVTCSWQWKSNILIEKYRSFYNYYFE